MAAASPRPHAPAASGPAPLAGPAGRPTAGARQRRRPTQEGRNDAPTAASFSAERESGLGSCFFSIHERMSAPVKCAKVESQMASQRYGFLVDGLNAGKVRG